MLERYSGPVVEPPAMTSILDLLGERMPDLWFLWRTPIRVGGIHRLQQNAEAAQVIAAEFFGRKPELLRLDLDLEAARAI